MSTEHVTDELSAFLDGEAEDPEAIAAHLRRCAACQSRYLELRAASLTLRHLEGPDVAPAFTTRVMAQVREQGPPRRWRAPAAAWTVVSAAAAVLVVVSGYFVRTSTPTAAPEATLARIEERLWAELERRVQTGEMETALDLTDSSDYLANSDLFMALASESWFDELVEEVHATAESADLLRSLDTTEIEEFNSLVVSTLGKG